MHESGILPLSFLCLSVDGARNLHPAAIKAVSGLTTVLLIYVVKIMKVKSSAGERCRVFTAIPPKDSGPADTSDVLRAQHGIRRRGKACPYFAR